MFLIRETSTNQTLNTQLKRRERQKATKSNIYSENVSLTLDVNRDTDLLAIGDCLVGGLTYDLLTCLNVGG